MKKIAHLPELSRLIASIPNALMAECVLNNLFTPQELEEISLRLQIFKMLKKGIPQRSIAQQLKVSIGTVSRGSRELQYGPPGIIHLLS